MKKLNIYLLYTAYTFSFLYSGTALYCPYYSSGMSFLHFAVTGTVIILYTFAVSCFFSKNYKTSGKQQAGYFGVTACVLTVLYISVLTANYVKSYESFSEYYSKPFTLYFALGAILICGIYGAYKGKECVSGLAVFAVPIFFVWTFAGFFAFFTTKNIVPLESPFSSFDNFSITLLLKNTAYICVDTTLLAYIIFENEDSVTRRIVRKSLVTGAAGFVFLSGINLIRNLLLFGEAFAGSIKNPDLAAIRLIPMLNLPEISIIVNTFGCAVKAGTYSLFIFYLLKGIFRERYASIKSAAVLFAGSGVVSGIIVFSGMNVSPADTFPVICMTLCAFICYVIRFLPENRQKYIK